MMRIHRQDSSPALPANPQRFYDSVDAGRDTTISEAERRQDDGACRLTCEFSPDRKYRYTLWRTWSGWRNYGGKEGVAMFIGLNPSTADETQDDPTVRRCIGYAKDWGYAGLCMTNLFAFRATDPAVMIAAENPVGPDNDFWLNEAASQASIVVAAWGAKGKFKSRDMVVRRLLPDLYYLRLTKDGFPAHPLYLPKDLRPVPWV